MLEPEGQVCALSHIAHEMPTDLFTQRIKTWILGLSVLRLNIISSRSMPSPSMFALTTSPDDHTLPQLLFASLKSTTSIKLPLASSNAQL